VIREETFTQSHAPYAVDLGSLTVEDAGAHGHSWAAARAVWFRRRREGGGPMVTAACLGELRDLQKPAPADARQFLAQYTDGRYGGRCQARWNGKTMWLQPDLADPDHYKAAMELLGPMLANYPAVPEGWNGWWVFRG